MNRLRPLVILVAAMSLQISAQVAASAASSTQIATATRTADALVDELVEDTAREHATLPSLTAHESIVSKVDEHVWVGKNTAKAEATVRIVRKAPDGNWTEIREFTVFDGKPVTSKTRVFLPFTLDNSFDDHQGDFFSSENRPCYHFSLAAPASQDLPLELTITPRTGAGNSAHCMGRSGMVRIDPVTHRLIHLEFAYLPNANISQWIVSVDYAATKVGDRVFNLPSVVATHIVLEKTPKEWTAHYSDYHQYTSSVTIRPADGGAE